MPFLPPNQQRQSTEGINSYTMHAVKITPNLLFEYRCTVQAANLSDCRIESNRNFFCLNWNALRCSDDDDATDCRLHAAALQPLKHTCSRYVTQVTDRASGAARGRRREASPLCVGVRKLCNMCALSLSWNFYVSHDKYIARPSSHVDTQTIQPGLGDFVL